MSFYDLTKDSILSAKDLFKYHGKRDSTLPSKGGQKDFEPDESWMQSKALEAFMQERASVLAEPRVEKLKNLVEGKWDGEQGLISLNKPGKFWAHMGFTDKRRNWLYPEEALFLMECNTLEVYHGGVPLSIQEAYNLFLGSDVSIEEYQVFSHLRRLGFVVLRHETQPLITPYERQINLDKYVNKKSRKDRTGKFSNKGKISEHSMMKSNGTKNLNHNSVKTLNPLLESDKLTVNNSENVDESKKENHINSETSRDFHVPPESCLKGNATEAEKCSLESVCLSTCVDVNIVNSTSLCHESHLSTNLVESKQNKRPVSPEVESSHMSPKRTCLDTSAESCNSEVNLESVADIPKSSSTSNQDCFRTACRNFYDSSWNSCFMTRTKTLSSLPNTINNDASSDPMVHGNSNINKTDSVSQDESNCENPCVKMLPLPNIASTNMVILKPPNPHLLPENVNIEETSELLNYDIEKYHIMNPPREMSRQVQREEERWKQIQDLQFSFPEWIQGKPNIAASSWREYKQKLSEIKAGIFEATPVDHLWKGKVTPLLHPGKSWSHESVLDQLSIIKSADNETLLLDSDCVVDVKITYDVHLPDGRFKKSMPGVPNHRVCVSKCSSDLPGLAEIHQVWSRFKDNVPLHWAVVDSGDIAFYVFDSTNDSKVFL